MFWSLILESFLREKEREREMGWWCFVLIVYSSDTFPSIQHTYYYRVTGVEALFMFL